MSTTAISKSKAEKVSLSFTQLRSLTLIAFSRAGFQKFSRVSKAFQALSFAPFCGHHSPLAQRSCGGIRGSQLPLLGRCTEGPGRWWKVLEGSVRFLLFHAPLLSPV